MPTKVEIVFMEKNVLQNKLKSMFASSSKRNTLHRIIMHFVSSFLWTEIYVAHAHAHAHTHTHRHQYRFGKHAMLTFLIFTIFLIIRLPSQCHAVGYSYARFVGPVSGPEREILVHDDISGGSRVDYIARPEYQFSYGVEDSETQVLQSRKEKRVGDEVQGVYSVVDPDGTLRVVKYTADDLNGFQAEVITNGAATHHGHNDDDAIKDNGWHTVISNENENTHTTVDNDNDYEVHDQSDYDNDEDVDVDVDDVKSKDGTYYENDDDIDDDENNDQIEEYENDHSKEVTHADEYSEENDDDY